MALPSETQIKAFITTQDAANALLEAWADYSEANNTRTVSNGVVRAFLALTEENLTLIRSTE